MVHLLGIYKTNHIVCRILQTQFRESDNRYMRKSIFTFLNPLQYVLLSSIPYVRLLSPGKSHLPRTWSESINKLHTLKRRYANIY